MKPISQIMVERLEAYRSNPPSPSAPKRVLVIDDNLDFAKIIKEVAEGDGCSVEIVDDPQKAIDFVASTIPYSRVFIDLNFPGKITGVEALHRIKSILPNVPITIISGFIDDDFEKIAAGLGFDVFRKTSNLKELTEAIHKI